MINTGSIEVAANTSAGSPQEETLKLTAGVIHELKLEIPPGHVGLTGISFWIAGHPVFPSTAGQWFKGDNRELRFREWYKIKTSLNKMTIKAYNTDDTYAHTFYYEIGVLKDWQITPWLSVNRLIRFIQKLLARMGAA